MQFNELILRVLLEIRRIAPMLLIILVISLLLLLFLYIRYKHYVVTNKKDPLLGLFFGISKINSLKLAASFLKLLIILYYLIVFNEFVIMDYIIILLPTLVYCFIEKKFIKILENVFWCAVEILGLVAVNYIGAFAFSSSGTTLTVIAYLALSFVMMIYSVYIFYNEIIKISTSRIIDPMKVWEEEIKIREEKHDGR